MNPKKPSPAHSIRAVQELNRQHASRTPVLRSFGQDEQANVAPTAIIGLIIAGAIGAFLVFMMNNLIEGTAASQSTSCSTWYTGDTPGIASCQERVSNKLLIWGIGSFILILGAVGLGGFTTYKTGRNMSAAVFGTIVMGAVGTWLVFILGGMIEGSNATTKTNCATWYAGVGNEAKLAACKTRAEDKMAVWNIGSFVLVLGACGLGAVGGHFGGKAAANKFRNRGNGGGRRFGRPRRSY